MNTHCHSYSRVGWCISKPKGVGKNTHARTPLLTHSYTDSSGASSGEGGRDIDYGWGVVVVAKKLITEINTKQIIGDVDSQDPYIMDILLEVSTGLEDDQEDGEMNRCSHPHHQL